MLGKDDSTEYTVNECYNIEFLKPYKHTLITNKRNGILKSDRTPEELAKLYNNQYFTLRCPKLGDKNGLNK